MPSLVPEDKPMTEPKFNQTLSDRTVKDGESVTLKCVVAGDPEPQVEWLKNGAVSFFFPKVYITFVYVVFFPPNINAIFLLLT